MSALGALPDQLRLDLGDPLAAAERERRAGQEVAAGQRHADRCYRIVEPWFAHRSSPRFRSRFSSDVASSRADSTLARRTRMKRRARSVKETTTVTVIPSCSIPATGSRYPRRRAAPPSSLLLQSCRRRRWQRAEFSAKSTSSRTRTESRFCGPAATRSTTSTSKSGATSAAMYKALGNMNSSSRLRTNL